MVKQPTIAEKIRVNIRRLRWFGHVQRMEGNRISQKSNIYEFVKNKVER
jgi:chromosome condensin MukBEF MukE localization factor